MLPPPSWPSGRWSASKVSKVIDVVILIIPAMETSWYRVGGQYSTSKTTDTAGANQRLRGYVGVKICCEGGACAWVCVCVCGGCCEGGVCV